MNHPFKYAGVKVSIMCIGHVTPDALLELRQLRRSVSESGRRGHASPHSSHTSIADPYGSYSIEHR